LTKLPRIKFERTFPFFVADTMDTRTPAEYQQEIHTLKRENINLKMRLVKIMVILDNTKTLMEKSKDAIMAQLADTNFDIMESQISSPN